MDANNNINEIRVNKSKKHKKNSNRIIPYIGPVVIPEEEGSKDPQKKFVDLNNNVPINTENPKNNKFLKIFGFIGLGIIIAGVIAILSIIFIKFLKKDETNKGDNSLNDLKPVTGSKNVIIKEEIKKAFENNFKISSKEDTLTQLLSKSTQNYNTIADGKISSYSTFTKAKYDIYTINGTSSGEDSDFYSTKYATTVAINSYCVKYSSRSLDEEDCELEEMLNFNYRDTSNLRRNDEENVYELIKQAILPLCIIEHTDSNIIISVTCPETLSSNLKNDIILAFQTIKPESVKGLNYDENMVGTTVEKKNNKIYIKTFNQICEDYDGNPNKNMTCEVNKEIVTDNNGNVISVKKISNFETIMDEQNKYSKKLEDFIEDISNNNVGFNPENYKLNLKTFFDLTKSFMHKEKYISEGDFYDLAVNISSAENETKIQNTLRNLREEKDEKPGVHEENIFSKTIYDVTMKFDIINDIGLGESQSAKAITNYNYNKNQSIEDLSFYQLDTKLNETLLKYVILLKSGIKLSNNLYEKIDEPLTNLGDIITENINELNNFLAFDDLSSIFDSTYAVNEIERLPFEFKVASDNLYNNLNNLYNNIPEEIGDIKTLLKNEIKNFLATSHNLLFKIYDNLADTTNALSSTNNRIVEILSYYLNHTDTSYSDKIKKAKEILDNYYKNEINKIVPLLNDILSESKTNAIESLKKDQDLLDNIVDNLDIGKTTIYLANNEDVQNTIKNIYNSKIKANDIINDVEKRFRDSLNIQTGGYFETQMEINNNKQSYGRITEKAENISYNLDNNKLIDLTFDSIMAYFREQFITMLNYIDKSKNEKFPLREEVLESSLFDQNFINELDSFFEEQKKIISENINDENNHYFDSINAIFESFKKENNNNISNILSSLKSEISEINLFNLNNFFNKSLILAKNEIEKIIEKNYHNSLDYLTKVKNSGSTHRTAAFTNKYNAYINSLNQVRNFIKINFKNNIVIKYKAIINDIRSLLQSVKSNPTLSKYFNLIPFSQNHMNEILKLSKIFNSYFSEEFFNTNYLAEINNFITSTINNLNQMEANIAQLYSSVRSLTYSSSNTYDYYLRQTRCYGCCALFWWICWIYSTCCDSYYAGYTVQGTNNYQNLEVINFSEYYLKFDEKYSEIKSKLSNDIKIYNSILSDLNDEIEKKAKQIFNQDNNTFYLNDISNKINNIINEKLGNNLMFSSYNYYKNDLMNKLPNELNNILVQWKNIYDKIYEDLNSNKNEFKSGIDEFYLIASFYSQMIANNITFEFGDFIVDKYKNEFNYTIRYYYDLIESKIKKIYSYIFNNMPIAQKPLDEIINIRINEINESYTNIMSRINDSKNEILKKENQLHILNVNEKNFFLINDIINENIDVGEEQLEEKVTKLYDLAEDMEETSEELIVARFYLENAQEGKQINEIYANIDKENFIDFQYNAFKELIQKNFKVDVDDLIYNIKILLKDKKEYIEKNFKSKVDDFNEILEGKIESELFTKDELQNEINNIYYNGLNNLNQSYKDEIYGYIDEILNFFTSLIENETKIIDDHIDSYSKNYTIIEETMNRYKKSIYEQFKSTINSVLTNFYNNILTKFHINYIEENLKQFQNFANKEKFTETKMYSTSLNLSYTITQNLSSLISDYKDLSKSKIDFLYKKYLQDLEEMFSFNEMEKIINDNIDNLYNNSLKPALDNKASDPNDKEYKLDEIYLQSIDKIFKEKIEQAKDLMEKMKGENYDINYYWEKPDFSRVNREEFTKIKNIYTNFTDSFSDEKDINNAIKENLSNNFKKIINNFVPFFGKDFFDRNIKYNENQKLKGLYKNLKYSIGQTVLNYVGLCVLYSGEVELPKDISLKIITLNDIESLINNKNEEIIASFNSKLDIFFRESKNYLIEEYNQKITNNIFLQTELGEDIQKLIVENLPAYRYVSEDIYINEMNNYIRIPFLEEYKRICNEQKKDMLYYIEKRKNELKAEFEDLFILDSDAVLADINNKLKNLKDSIDMYNNHFNDYKNISEFVKNYLINFGKDSIWPKYQEIKDLIDKYLLEPVFDNLDKYSELYENEYSIINYDSKVDSAISNFSYYINSTNKNLEIYKLDYSDQLENEINKISNNNGMRRLEEVLNQQTIEATIEENINGLKNKSILIIQFLENLNEFNTFDEKIKKYNNELASQVKYSEYVLNKNKERNNNYDKMLKKLKELKELGENYYLEANKSYHNMKDFIINKTNEIKELIDICSNITFETLANYYIKYKEEFIPIKNTYSKKKEILALDYENNDYVSKVKIKNYLIENEISLDIVFEENDIKKPKVIGRIINNVIPDSFIIDFYSNIINGKFGREIDLSFKNISSNTLISFDARTNKAVINTDFKFDEYTINQNFYNEKEKRTSKKMGGANYNIITKGNSNREPIDPPENEKLSEDIPSKNKNRKEEYYF